MNFFDSLMSPLSRDHCLLFYIIGLVSLLFAILALVGFVVGLFRKNSQYAMGAYFMSFLSNMVLYYVSRIHYSICVSALR
jgi:hypothetical protein|uniref:Uncharacterized protein n=1 Tax=viral metagenome TaxID=1070528 RepID=A0A6C0DVJ5_9ZZZZ